MALLCACARPEPARGRLEEVRFHSEALGEDKTYFVWLPPGYEGSPRRWPVIYVLHGYGGDETDAVRDAHIDEVADRVRLQAILVMPDGDNGFWVDWATAGRRYETYVVHDLIRHVDATWRTTGDRRGRALSGMSMGGFGALTLALRNPAVFSSASSHAGLVSLVRFGPPRGLTAHFEHVFGADRDRWRAHDPAELAATADGSVSLYFDCGSADQLGFADRARHLHDVLAARNLPHAFTLVPGGRHEGEFWASRVEHSLRFHAARFP